MNIRAMTWPVWAGLLIPACGGSSSESIPVPEEDVEWVTIQYAGGSIPVAILKPDGYSDTGTHPVIFALPWGAGTPDLALGMVDAYWSVEAPRRGYIVITAAILGPSLATEADAFLPALFDWMEQNLSFDPSRVVLAGASNGGRGVFHALVSDPSRFQALIGMPGSYAGSVGSLTPFASKQAWLMVGESDTGWRKPVADTKLILDAAGVTTQLDVLPGQGHVLFVSQSELMDWVDQAVEGS